MRRMLLGALAVGLATVAPAQFFDDFNRPDAPNLGPNWTFVANINIILSNRVTNGAVFNGMSTVNPLTSGYLLANASVDVFAGNGLNYVSLVTGFAGVGQDQALFTKIQDNDGDGVFDFVGLYTGNNVNTGGGLFIPLITPTASARIHMFSPTADSFAIGIDNNFDNVIDETHVRTGVLGFAGSLGNGFGLGVRGNAFADDYSANVIPEPGSMAVLAIGIAALAARRRRLKR